MPIANHHQWQPRSTKLQDEDSHSAVWLRLGCLLHENAREIPSHGTPATSSPPQRAGPAEAHSHWIAVGSVPVCVDCCGFFSCTEFPFSRRRFFLSVFLVSVVCHISRLPFPTYVAAPLRPSCLLNSPFYVFINPASHPPTHPLAFPYLVPGRLTDCLQRSAAHGTAAPPTPIQRSGCTVPHGTRARAASCSQVACRPSLRPVPSRTACIVHPLSQRARLSVVTSQSAGWGPRLYQICPIRPTRLSHRYVSLSISSAA
ncbi:hypothetical protein IWZ01DRAFT_508995 [Phyllosticta capitalensis]